MVREIIKNDDGRKTYTNIVMHKTPKRDVETIKHRMIFKDKVVKTKKDGEKITKKVLNIEYWKSRKDKNKRGINVILDEAHTLIDSRRSMSTENRVMNDFLALLRRILGDSGAGYGELVLITQLKRRIDVNARELATSVHYHVAHYTTVCPECGFEKRENNEQYNYMRRCLMCGNNKLRKKDFVIEKWEFDSMDNYELWKEHGLKRYENHYYVTDIEQYFDYYDTFQWENLITE